MSKFRTWPKLTEATMRFFPGMPEKIFKLNAMLKDYATKDHIVYVDYWSA
jgi:hypothetical protein